jgi:hypothetical protein
MSCVAAAALRTDVGATRIKLVPPDLSELVVSEAHLDITACCSGVMGSSASIVS